MADPYFKYVSAQFRATKQNLLNLNSSFPNGWIAFPTVNTKGNSPTISSELTFLNPFSFKFLKPQVIALELNVSGGTIPCDPGRFASDDFTVEGRFYATSIATSVVLVECYQSISTGWYLMVNSNGTIQLKEKNLTVTLISSTGGPLFQINTKHHVALTRTSSVLRLFLDGVKIAETTLLTSHTWATGNPTALCVGGLWNSRNTAYDLDGYADDIRITKFISRYTADFTPPIASDFTEYDPYATSNFYTVADIVKTTLYAPEATFTCKELNENKPVSIIDNNFLGSHNEGTGEINDTISISNVPSVAKVTLLERESKTIVRQTYSDSDGAFSLKGIDKQASYMLIGEDSRGSVVKRNAAIRDFVSPKPKILITKKPSTFTAGQQSGLFIIRTINFDTDVTITLSSEDDITFSSNSIVIKTQNNVGYFTINSLTTGLKSIKIQNSVTLNNPPDIEVNFT